MQRGRQRESSLNEKEESNVEVKNNLQDDQTDRATAAQKYLEFLAEEDKEESQLRAKYRGEESNQSQNELFIIKEEMVIPNDDSNSKGLPLC